jgi:hypothetical protein
MFEGVDYSDVKEEVIEYTEIKNTGIKMTKGGEI